MRRTLHAALLPILAHAAFALQGERWRRKRFRAYSRIRKSAGDRMPLPASSPRTELHHRRIDMHGYRREDGLYEIDGRVLDTKKTSASIAGGKTWDAGQHIHDMGVRLIVDEDLLVHDVIAVSDTTPYAVCKEATAAMKAIVGQRIAAGWTMMVKSRLGGAKGCTHLMELLIPLATAAFQTIAEVRLSRPDKLNATGRPVKIDSCYAFAANRDIVERRWPAFYTGARTDEGHRVDDDRIGDAQR
jgi:hypothetical protein